MKSVWTMVGILAAGAGLAGCRKGADEAPQAARAVRAVTLAATDAQGHRRYAATLQPKLEVELAFKVGGRVAAVAERDEGGVKRLLQSGDPVTSGQLLARLDPDDLRRNERAAMAAFRTAQAQAAAAAAALAQAGREVERARVLVKTDTISRADLDRAEAGFASAQAQRDAADGQRQAKREQYELAKTALADAGLKSPIDGVVTRRMVEVGEMAAPGKPAFVLVDTRELKAVFGVPDTRIGALRAGQKVAVRVSAMPGQRFEGTISRLDQVADAAMRSFTVEVTIPNAEAQLRAGMVADVVLEAGEAGQELMVPLAAVLRDASRPGGFAVYRLGDDGAAAFTPVVLGEVADNAVVVEEGLEPGARVVTDGAQFLRQGERVQVVP